MDHDVIVLGAGIAGLQCAKTLRDEGLDVLLVDRGRRPGGRCATRVIEGQTVDYGPLFLHGRDPQFIALLESLEDAGPIWGWPSIVDGHGTPCQPAAFEPRERRVAFAAGIATLPLAIASGLDVRSGTHIETIEVDDGGVLARSNQGEEFRGRDLVLALALEQTVPFLLMLPDSRERDSALALLELFASLPTLTVVAGYASPSDWPTWHISYPENSDMLMLVSNETSKRDDGKGSRVLVYQASARWSRKHVQEGPESWSRPLLDEAARRLGSWAGSPDWIHPHRWRYGRVDRGNELAAPVIVRVGKTRVGLAGDIFAPGGGAQAAWVAGDRLARRLTGE